MSPRTSTDQAETPIRGGGRDEGAETGAARRAAGARGRRRGPASDGGGSGRARPTRRLRPGRLPLALLATLALVPLAAAAAARAQPADRRFQGALSSGIYVDARLAQLPYDVVTGHAQTRGAGFLELDLGARLLRFDIPLPFCGGCALRGNAIEGHGNLTQYFGDQTNAEIGAYLMFRTGWAPLPAQVQANFAIGLGISYAFSAPDLEIAASDGRKYLTQAQVPVEIEWWHPAFGDRATLLLPRIHHRSGMFGVIAPSGVGSNFVGAGLRIGFP
jgi:hypothetical protein